MTNHRSPRSIVHRWTWGVADQAVVSVVNLACGVAVARAVPQSTFGAFAIALTVYWFALGLSRAITNEPYAIRFSSNLRQDRAGAGAAAGTSVLLGAGVATVALIVSAALAAPLRTALVSIALVLPMLMLQDFVRTAAFVARRASFAFIADGVWLASFLGACALLTSSGSDALVGYVLAWGLTGGISAAVGLVLLRIEPRITSSRSWISRNRDIIPRLAVEASAAVLMFQLYIVVVGVIAGLDSVGSIRAAQLLFGPWQVLLMGTMLVALPEAARLLAARGAANLVQFALVVGGGLAAVAVIWGAVLVALPETLGTQILGDSWTGAAPLLLLTGISLAPLAAISGAGIGLRALAAVRRSLPSQIATAVIVVTGAAAGASLGGARGALVGVTIAGVASACIWWWQLLAASHAYAGPGTRRRGAARVAVDENL